MVGADGFSHQRHLGFGRSPIPLLVIAFHTGACQVLPRILAPAGARNHMIHRESDVRTSAILTTVAIASQNVFSGEDDLFERHTDVDREADDAWKRHRQRNGMKKLSIQSGNQFGFAQIKEDDCFLNIADAQWLVVMVQNEYFAVHPKLSFSGARLPIRPCTVNRCAEVSNTS